MAYRDIQLPQELLLRSKRVTIKKMLTLEEFSIKHLAKSDDLSHPSLPSLTSAVFTKNIVDRIK